MGEAMRAGAVLVASILIGGILLSLLPGESRAESSTVLVIGDRGQIGSLNVLRVHLGPYRGDGISVGVLSPVYSNLVLEEPVAGVLRPYIAKGVDADSNGVFDLDEYGQFGKEVGTNESEITVYLDFNGVRFHDGVQMTEMDLLATLFIASLSPVHNPGLRVLMDDAGAPTSNVTWSRWLAVDIVPKSWAGEGALPGNPALRSAVRFQLQAPFARFYESVLADIPLLPRHVWELTGGGRHADFGRAIYPEGDLRRGQGVPVNEAVYRPFDYAAADAWQPSDADVIGSGPFRFESLAVGGSTHLRRNDAYYVGAEGGTAYDARLAGVVHRPHAHAIEFRTYRTAQLGYLALRSGEIDHYRGAVPLEFLPDLLMCCPSVRIWTSPSPGFTQLAFNLRRPPFGYSTWPPADSELDDVGKPLRLAFARLVDKEAIVRTYLQNFGVAADSVVSPANLAWVNSSIPRIEYEPARAALMMDNAGWIDADGDGWREFPRFGDAQFSILTPTSDYPRFPESYEPAYWIATVARSIGVNVVAEPFPGIPNPFWREEFAMLVSSWHIEGTDPAYLTLLFDCSEGWRRNYAGYCDAEFDRVIEASERSVNRDERARLIRWAQGILMEDRPVDPIYFPTAFEATREDRFTNWTMTGTTVWHYWSWIGVRPLTSLVSMSLSVRYDTAMAGGTPQRLAATVRDEAGRALAGAAVTFRILPSDAGRFVETSAAEVSGTTDATGSFAPTYEAPHVTDIREVSIEVLATHPDMEAPVQRILLLTVFPEGARFLSLRVSLPAGDIGMPDHSLPLRIEVFDESQFPARNAEVAAFASPANGSLSRTNGSAADMSSLTFTPPPDLRATLEYRVSILASSPGRFPAFANISVLIVYFPERANPPTTSFPSSTEAIVAGLATTAAAGAVGAALLMLWYRRWRRAGR